MNLPLPQRINREKPVLEMYEDGDWLRIEVPGKRTRYLSMKLATQILYTIGSIAVTDKSDIIVRERDLV